MDHEVPERTRRVRVVADHSASMARLYDSGAVFAAADIVAGIAAVIGDGDRVGLVVSSSATVPPGAKDVEPATLGETLAADASGIGTNGTSGFGVGAGVSAPPTSGSELTVIITDGAGAALAAADPEPQSVVLALTAAASIARRPGFVGALCPPPAPGTDARQALVDQPELVRAVVTGLLRAAGVVGAR